MAAQVSPRSLFGGRRQGVTGQFLFVGQTELMKSREYLPQVALRRQQAQEECEARELGLLYSSAVHNTTGNGATGNAGGTGGGGRINHSNATVTGGGLFDGIPSPTSEINKADYQSSPTGKCREFFRKTDHRIFLVKCVVA